MVMNHKKEMPTITYPHTTVLSFPAPALVRTLYMVAARSIEIGVVEGGRRVSPCHCGPLVFA